MKGESKRGVILKMFNDAEWFESISYGPCKIIHYEDFTNANLSPCIEYRSKYDDVIYARNILQKLGYRVLISAAFNVYKRSGPEIAI